MAFDANKQLQIVAEETSPGRYSLRTKGLLAVRRPELEMIAVPEPALTAAASVLNLLADYSVNRAEIFDGQTVGNLLAVRGDARELLLVVRTRAMTAPGAGLWAKISGRSKGVLRLLDPEDDSQTPLLALATMLVHRAALRRAKDDGSGARTELAAAIAAYPGAVRGGPLPVIEGMSGRLNWQNHLAYLDLAELTEDPAERARLGDAGHGRRPVP